MPGLKVEILHLPEVQQALRDKAARLTPALTNAATVSRRLLVAELTKYPAERPGQRYVRTEALKRGWERASGVTGAKGFQLINPVFYAPYVQGDSQGRAFRGRWESATSIAHRLQEEVLAAYEKAVQEAIQ